MDKDEALKLLRGGPDGIKEWNRRREDGEEIPDLKEVGLWKARLSSANLSDVNLAGANLSRAVLMEANLSRADLSRADLSGAQLLGANLSRAKLPQARLSGAQLHGANLSRANLPQASLSGAQLHGANLSRANLSGAHLRRANLEKADLTKADFRGADLSSVNLTKAIVSDTDFEQSIVFNLGWSSIQGTPRPVRLLHLDELRDEANALTGRKAAKFFTAKERVLEIGPRAGKFFAAKKRGSVKETSSARADVSSLYLYFDAAEFSTDDIVRIIGQLSSLYADCGGDELVIEDMTVLDPSLVEMGKH